MRTTLLRLALAGALAARRRRGSRRAPLPSSRTSSSSARRAAASASRELKGNVVLLNVWATWCGPCKQELPVVQKMYDTYSDRNFVVVAVNVDADRRRVAPFLKQFNISLPVYYAAPEDAGPLTATGIPRPSSSARTAPCRPRGRLLARSGRNAGRRSSRST